METQYKYDSFSWEKNHDEECTIKDGISTQQEDGTVTLLDARCLLGKDPFEITIPDTILSDDGETDLRVTEIVGWAFNKCQYIRRLNLSKHVTLEKFAAYDLPLLESVTVSEENEELASKDGVLYTKDFSKIIYWPAAKIDFSSLNNDTPFADTAFYGAKIDHDSFPIAIREYYKKKSWKLNEEGMTAEPSCFEDFKDKDGNIFIPDSFCLGGSKYIVNRISNEAREDSYDITNIILPETIEHISDFAFQNYYHSLAKRINIPSRIKSIGSFACIPLCGIRVLDLPNTLESLGIVAFLDNKYIKQITIPRGLKNGEFIYDFCNLEEIRLKDSLSGEVNLVLVDGVLFTADMKTLLKYPVGKKDEYYAVPDSVENILPFAFANNKYIKEVKLSEALSTIIDYKSSVSELDETYPNLNVSLEGFKNVVESSFDWDARFCLFPGCDNLKNVVLPHSLKHISSCWMGSTQEKLVITQVCIIDELDYENVRIKDIEVEDGCERYFLYEGGLYEKNEDKISLIYVPESYDKPDFRILNCGKRLESIKINSSKIKRLIIPANSFPSWGTDIELPNLEEVVLEGDDEEFYIENGRLYRKDLYDRRPVISLSEKQQRQSSFIEELVITKDFDVRDAYNIRYYRVQSVKIEDGCDKYFEHEGGIYKKYGVSVSLICVPESYEQTDFHIMPGCTEITINNTKIKRLFIPANTIRSYGISHVELPNLEEIILEGEDENFYIEDGSLYEKRLVLSPSKMDKKEKSHSDSHVDKYFRSKELNMYIHVDKDNNVVAKMLSCKRREWLEDYEDEETGEVVSILRSDILSEEYPVEYQLPQDSLTNYWGEYCYGNNVLESISEEEYNAYGQDEVLRLKQEDY